MKASTLRRLLFAAAFLTAVVSAALVPGDGPAPKRAAKAPAPAPTAALAPRATAPRDVEVPTLLAYRRSIGEGVDVVDIFEARVPPSAAAAPAKPVPPVLPFTYVGLIEEAGITKVVLAQGDQLHVVAIGEQFANSYRMEGVGPDQAVVTYLPLDVKQTVTPTPAPGAPGAPGVRR